MSNKSRDFLNSLKKKSSKQVNPDALFPVDSDGIPVALPADDLPTKDATGVLDVSSAQVIEIIPGAKIHEHTVMVPIGDVYIPAPDAEGNMGHVRTKADQVADAELDMSIKHNGILMPLIVRPATQFGIERMAVMKGGRRLESARRLGLTHVPVIVRAINRRDAVRMNYAMTAHNQTLSTPEKAQALKQIFDDMKAELTEFVEANGLMQKRGERKPVILSDAEWQERRAKIRNMPTWMELCFEQAVRSKRRVRVSTEVFAQYVGTSPNRMSELLRVAQLPPELISTMTGRQAESLTSLKDPKALQQLAQEIQHDKLTGEQAKAVARKLTGQTPAPPGTDFTVSRTVRVNPATDTPVEYLKAAVSQANQAGELLKNATISEQFKAELLREIEMLETLTAELRRMAG